MRSGPSRAVIARLRAEVDPRAFVGWPEGTPRPPPVPPDWYARREGARVADLPAPPEPYNGPTQVIPFRRRRRGGRGGKAA